MKKIVILFFSILFTTINLFAVELNPLRWRNGIDDNFQIIGNKASSLDDHNAYIKYKKLISKYENFFEKKSEKNVSKKKDVIKKSLNEKDKKGYTPLFYAISSGDEELVHKMLKYGADPNVQYENDKKPVLFFALEKCKNTKIIDYLVKYEADCNYSYNNNEYKNFTPLLAACIYSDNIKIIELIYNHTTQKDVKGTFLYNGELFEATPFSFLIVTRNNDNNIISFLNQLVNNVDIDLEMKKGGIELTPLQWILIDYTNNKYPLVNFLVKHHANKDSSFVYQNLIYTPLFISIQKQNEKLFNLILDDINSINTLISYKKNSSTIEATVLAYLIQENPEKNQFQRYAITLLKEMGGKIETGNNSLFSILAMGKPDEKMIIDFLDTNIDPSVPDSNGKNVIDYAFEKNLSLVINWLLENKIEIGNSLYYAIDNELNGNQSFIKEFLNISKKNIKPKTIKTVDNDSYISCSPIVYTMLMRPEEDLSQQRIKIINELIKAGYDINETIKGGKYNGSTPLMFAAKLKSSQIVDYLIENGADANKQNAIGKTALFFALEAGNKNAIKSLLSILPKVEDIKLNSNDEEYRSLLMYFAQYGDFELLKEWVPKIVDNDKYALERTDSKGMTPFLYAAAYNSDYRAMKVFRMYGANVYAKDKAENSAYVLANENTDNENIKKIKLDRIHSYGVYE